ncbi:hypothetical protein Tco_1382966, partial [Tanacetum coccineum]
YMDADIADFEARLTRIYRREVHRVQVFNFERLLDLMAEGLSARMLMEHRDAQGQSVFTSRAWRRLFDIRGPLVHELILEVFSTFRFGDATVGFVAYWAESPRQILDMKDLSDYWIGISSARDFFGTTPSYTVIRDLILRLCHRLIAGRCQAPEKGLTVISLELMIIDMAELVRLQICMEVYGTWAWVAMRPERHPNATVVAPRVAQDATAVDEGVQAIPAPVQAPHQPLPPPPPAAARTLPQRMSRLAEDVHEIRRALAEHREVIGAMARDFSRFTVWATCGIAQPLDFARVTYTPYSETRIPYQRRVRRRTDDASTSTA